MPARRINEIVHGQRPISADTARRLARFFGTSERFWINLQARYDLEAEKDRLCEAQDPALWRVPERHQAAMESRRRQAPARPGSC